MNAIEFVRAIEEVVFRGAVRGVLKLLRKPPGRRPNPELVELSTWFNKLAEADREYVAKAVCLGADHATYGFLGVLDGVCAIEGSGRKGLLELAFKKDGQRILLNNPDTPFLTEIFKEVRSKHDD